jgi:hypothetical protein
MNLFEKLTKLLLDIFNKSLPDDQSNRFIKRLMLGLNATRDDEVSCDEVFELLDQYAEMVDQGEDASILMPLIKHHLDMCPECEEEYKALLRIIQTAPSIS